MLSVSEKEAVAIGTVEPLRRSELALLYLPLFAVALGYGAILPVLPSVLARMHGGADIALLPLHAGLLTGIYIGAFVVAAPLWGRVADLARPHAVLGAGLLGYAGATVWFGFVDSLPAAYVARFVAGAFAAGLLPATSTLISRRCRGEDRARHLGWLSAASVLGFLAGPWLSGGMHSLLSSPAFGRSAIHLTAIPIWTSAVIALATAVGVVWNAGMQRDPEPLNADIGRPREFPRRVTDYEVLLLSALGAFGIGAFEVAMTLQAQGPWRWQAGELAGLFAVCSLVMLAIQLFLFTRLRRYAGGAALIVGGFAAMAAGLALLGLSPSYGAALALVALVALGSGVLMPTLSVLTAEKAVDSAGEAIGYLNAAGNLGQAAGSVAAGWLFAAIPGESLWATASLMIVGALLSWRRFRVRAESLSRTES